VRQVESSIRLAYAALVPDAKHLLASDSNGSLVLIRVTDGQVVASERLARPRRLDSYLSSGGIVASVDSFRTRLRSRTSHLIRRGGCWRRCRPGRW